MKIRLETYGSDHEVLEVPVKEFGLCPVRE